jgi:putative solute:sodium symporter small subunit
VRHALAVQISGSEADSARADHTRNNVTDPDQTVWWPRTAQLAAAVLAGFAAVASVPLLFAARFNRGTFVGLPFGDFLIGLATPVALAAAIFWFAHHQRALDHLHDVVDD